MLIKMDEKGDDEVDEERKGEIEHAIGNMVNPKTREDLVKLDLVMDSRGLPYPSAFRSSSSVADMKSVLW